MRRAPREGRELLDPDAAGEQACVRADKSSGGPEVALPGHLRQCNTERSLTASEVPPAASLKAVSEQRLR